MGKQQWYVAILAILVAVAGPALAQDGDPNLVGWWAFDGDTLDSSGNGRHGTLAGDATLVEVGLWGGAVSLDGSGDYVTIGGYKGILADADGVQQPFTVAAWVKTTNSGDRTIASWGTNDNKVRVDFRLYQGRLRVEHGAGNRQGDTTLNDGDWHHVALTMIAGATVSHPDVQLWLDGVDDTRSGTDPDVFAMTAGVDMAIGYRATAAARYFLGDIDEVRLYDRVLTAEEMAGLARRPRSYAPDPATGSVIGATQLLLQWTPGGFAAEHDVYFGTNPTPGPEELVGRQTDAQYMALALEQEKTYYWRIDDVAADGTLYTGDTWSFWIEPRRAYDPQPLDGLINVFTDAQLSWTAGWSPLMHAVYFGTNADEVANMAGAMPQMDALSDPGPLELETTYYWRVDEFYAGQWVAGPVWSFTTVPPIAPIDEPNLVAWYPLDEGAGRTALDQTGNDRHGSFAGDPTWADGVEGGALAFDGSGGDYVEAPEAPSVTGTHSRAVTAWIKTADYGEIASWGQNVAGQKWIFRVQESNGTLGAIRVEVNGGYQVGSIDVRDNEWHHAAAVLVDDGSPDVNEIALYVDGFLESISAQADEPINTAAGVVRIGQSPWGTRPFVGLIDDVRIYDTAYTEDEMRQMFGNLAMAWQPQPEHGAVGDVLTITSVSWTPGDGAVAHDVYLSGDPNALAVTDASDATGVYRGRQAETVYAPPEDLSLGQTYYWRIDEVDADGNVTAGRVWSFTLANGILVETAEMTLVYDNTVEPYMTEIALDIAQDWSHPDLVDLSLEFQGAPPVFVEDADGVITMSGAGGDIWGSSDEFRYAYKTLNGDATMVARVLDNGTGSNAWSKGGVMIRQSLDAGSTHAFMPITGGSGQGYSFQRRPVADAASTSDNGVAPPVAPPYWVKIQRTGDDFSAYISPDGEAWAEVGTPQTIAMTDPVLIGLAVTSHVSGDLRAYQFDSVSSTGDVTGDWQVADVGVEQGGNDPAPLYVAVEDAAGGSATAVHPDPAATNITECEWRIPLADLAAAGVDLGAVVKVAVGVGDGQPDGTGTVTIRNIQVVPPVAPVITVAPAEIEATGDDGMVLSINGIAVEDLVLGITSTDFEKFADHPAPHADDFDLGTYASLDDSSYITMMFDVPVSAIFIIERGANDLGLLQPLDAAGDPVGGLAAFAKTDWFKPGIKINNQAAGAIVITAEVPTSGIMVLPAEGANMGLDPASVSAIPAE